jgi:Arc/MetJ-type ribon-helix-helix transcriptional regulator
MKTAKIAVSLDKKTVAEVDRLVKRGSFPSRSSLVQQALEEKLRKMGRSRLASECLKLDADFEKRLSEEGMVAEAKEWPEY